MQSDCMLHFVSCNNKNDLQSHSRSLISVKFDRPHIISYQSSIVTMSLSCTIFRYYHLFAKISRCHVTHPGVGCHRKTTNLIQPTCVQNLTTVASVIPEIRLGAQKFKIGHVIVSTPIWGIIRLPRLILHMGVQNFKSLALANSRDILERGGGKIQNGSLTWCDYTPFMDGLLSISRDLLRSTGLSNLKSLHSPTYVTKGNAKCTNSGDFWWLEVIQCHWQHNHSLERMRLPIWL